MKLHQLTNRVFWTPGDHETDRPTLGCICGDRHTLLIDCGASPAHIREMLSALQDAGLPSPTLAVVTHAHWDHVFGMSALNIPVIASTRTQQQLIRMESWAWTEEAMLRRLHTREDILFCHEHMLKEYPDPSVIRVRRADIVFDEALSLDLGGCTVHLRLLPNSHAEDCAVILCPEEGVLFTGDITYMDLHADPPCWHTRRYHALLSALAETDFTTAVPGHQEPMERSAFFADLRDALRADAAEGIPLIDD